jgi:ATP-binding cassette subfamily D (ALD) long-chain fatty acid import protein
MYAYKDILELAGLTTRLYALLSALHNLPPLPASSPADGGPSRVTLDNVDVCIPASGTPEAPLVKALGLSFSVGEHLMITGSNGVGKTAVARVLAGLWRPGNEGECKIHRPGRGELFVVPQRAYMVTGSLLDQYVSCIIECFAANKWIRRIIYPHSYPQFLQSGRTMEELVEILEAVHLSYLPSREGGWQTRKEWRDVLSGGEKQRVSRFFRMSGLCR